MTTRNRCFIGHQTAGDHLEGRIPESSLVCVLPAAAAVDPSPCVAADTRIVARVDPTHALAATREANAADGRSAMSISLQPEPAR